MRSLLVSVLLAVVVSVPAGAAVQPGADVRLAQPERREDLRHALAVLHDWDERRAHAWALDDEPALRDLYVQGSGAARADLGMLRDYRARGLVVRRMQTQLLAVEVLVRRRTTLRLRVLDRVAGGEVLRDGEAARLRATRPAAHTIVLRLVDGRWRVLTVSGSAAAPRAAQRRHRGR